MWILFGVVGIIVCKLCFLSQMPGRASLAAIIAVANLISGSIAARPDLWVADFLVLPAILFTLYAGPLLNRRKSTP